ncbi:ADP/ATP carrier 2 [Actinidia rufa]|uniref:ADP/ATP carrier 2 n=1 Tax=Actinidia rufa TaxID=165716 RepID=A0A7J0F0M6_9ERIC|nr:ADP/ATP carrier 2 [Actinidia rufa]
MSPPHPPPSRPPPYIYKSPPPPPPSPPPPYVYKSPPPPPPSPPPPYIYKSPPPPPPSPPPPYIYKSPPPPPTSPPPLYIYKSPPPPPPSPPPPYIYKSTPSPPPSPPPPYIYKSPPPSPPSPPPPYIYKSPPPPPPSPPPPYIYKSPLPPPPSPPHLTSTNHHPHPFHCHLHLTFTYHPHHPFASTSTSLLLEPYTIITQCKSLRSFLASPPPPPPPPPVFNPKYYISPPLLKSSTLPHSLSPPSPPLKRKLVSGESSDWIWVDGEEDREEGGRKGTSGKGVKNTHTEGYLITKAPAAPPDAQVARKPFPETVLVFLEVEKPLEVVLEAKFKAWRNFQKLKLQRVFLPYSSHPRFESKASNASNGAAAVLDTAAETPPTRKSIAKTAKPFSEGGLGQKLEI